MSEDVKSYILGAGTEAKISQKDGKVILTIEIDEKKIAKAAIPALLGAFMGDEKPAAGAPKKGRPRKTQDGGPSGYDNPAVPPLPFPEPVGAAK